LLVRNWAGDGAVPEGSVQNVEMWWAATLAGSAFDVEAEKIGSCNTLCTHNTLHGVAGLQGKRKASF